MDEAWGYYVKQNKPDRERQTLSDSTCMWKLNKHVDKENRLVVTRGEGGWGMGIRGKGTHIYVYWQLKCTTEFSQCYKLFRPQWNIKTFLKSDEEILEKL